MAIVTAASHLVLMHPVATVLRLHLAAIVHRQLAATILMPAHVAAKVVLSSTVLTVAHHQIVLLMQASLQHVLVAISHLAPQRRLAAKLLHHAAMAQHVQVLRLVQAHLAQQRVHVVVLRLTVAVVKRLPFHGYHSTSA